MVYASSMVVYGEGRYRCPEHGIVRPGPRLVADLEQGRFEPPCPRCGRPLDSELVPEDAPLDPRNVYAATKVHTEHLCQAFARESGASVCGLRYHNVYGPRMPQGSPYAGVASIFRSALEAGQAAQVFEDGGQKRDFVHVRDVARANVLALDSDWQGALNVASGQVHTVLDMAEALTDAFAVDGRRPQVVGGYRTGDVRHVVASPHLAAEAIGFTAGVPFAEGMAEFADRPAAPPRRLTDPHPPTSTSQAGSIRSGIRYVWSQLRKGGVRSGGVGSVEGVAGGGRVDQPQHAFGADTRLAGAVGSPACTRAKASALASPSTVTTTRRARAIPSKVRVMRGWGLWPRGPRSSRPAGRGRRRGRPTPGKSEAVWPSGPSPRCTRSKRPSSPTRSW